MKRRKFKQCWKCKHFFEPLRSDAKYCSAACRMAVSRMNRSVAKAKADKEQDRKAHLYRYTMGRDRKSLLRMMRRRDLGYPFAPEIMAALADKEREWGIA